MRDVDVQGGDINGDKKEGGKGAEDGKEMVRIFDVRRIGTGQQKHKSAQ